MSSSTKFASKWHSSPVPWNATYESLGHLTLVFVLSEQASELKLQRTPNEHNKPNTSCGPSNTWTGYDRIILLATWPHTYVQPKPYPFYTYSNIRLYSDRFRAYKSAPNITPSHEPTAFDNIWSYWLYSQDNYRRITAWQVDSVASRIQVVYCRPQSYSTRETTCWVAARYHEYYSSPRYHGGRCSWSGNFE